jgi:hypothetical protein
MSMASRRSRVSGRLADISQCAAVRLYEGRSDSQYARACGSALKRATISTGSSRGADSYE